MKWNSWQVEELSRTCVQLRSKSELSIEARDRSSAQLRADATAAAHNADLRVERMSAELAQWRERATSVESELCNSRQEASIAISQRDSGLIQLENLRQVHDVAAVEAADAVGRLADSLGREALLTSELSQLRATCDASDVFLRDAKMARDDACRTGSLLSDSVEHLMVAMTSAGVPIPVAVYALNAEAASHLALPVRMHAVAPESGVHASATLDADVFRVSTPPARAETPAMLETGGVGVESSMASPNLDALPFPDANIVQICGEMGPDSISDDDVDYNTRVDVDRDDHITPLHMVVESPVPADMAQAVGASPHAAPTTDVSTSSVASSLIPRSSSGSPLSVVDGGSIVEAGEAGSLREALDAPLSVLQARAEADFAARGGMVGAYMTSSSSIASASLDSDRSRSVLSDVSGSSSCVSASDLF